MRYPPRVVVRWTLLALAALSACAPQDVELGTHHDAGVDALPTPDNAVVAPDAKAIPPAPDATPLTSCTPDGWCSFSGGLSLPGIDLRAVWVDSSATIYVVGDQGTILRHDGASWSKMATGVTADLHGIWGRSPQEIYAVGKGGTILRYDGATWTQQSSDTTMDLYGVAGFAPFEGYDLIWAVGAQWTIQVNDGYDWWGQSSGSGASFTAIWASGEQVYTLCSMGYVFGGQELDIVAGQGCGYPKLTAVWGADSGSVFVVGYTGKVLRYDGTTWHEGQAGQKDLHAVWGSGSANVFAAGQDGAILRYDGTSWTPMQSGTSQTLLGLGGSGPADVIAVGQAGTILRYVGP